MESLEIRHSILRERLDVLGMHQPLPLGAVSLVTALVDDIIKTNDSLKKSKDKINRLLDEKTAWDLGVEPYKCDNTRLVNESNRVHIQLIKEREQFELSLIELQKRIRDLESDRQYLKEHCSALEEKIIGYDKNAMRNRSDSNLGKKPFVSTVRSGINPLPPTHFSAFRNSIDNYKKCVNGDLTQAHYRREMQRAEDERKTWGDVKGCLENEINKRDKEIERLSLLLSGGRPTPSLARDCCRTYNTTEDIDSLQVAKQRLREELQEVQSAQHEAMERAMKLDILNQELHANLEALKNTALSMEAEANFKIDLKNKKISELKEKLKDHSKRLEYPMEGKNDVINTQIAFESERLKLKNELREMRFRETELKKTIDKLTKKNLKLNHKYDEITSSAASIRNGKSTSTELESIKNQRDNIQKQYLDLVQNGHSNEEFESLTRKLIDREHEITSLRKELDSRFVESTKSIPAQSVQSAINRAERERDVYKQDVQKLTYERDSLREKLKLCTDMQMVENERHARDIQDKQSSIYRLEQMNQELISSKGPTEVTATLQKQTINDLNKQLEKAEAEKQELHLKYNQLKMLQEQNERLLADHQKKVMHTEFQLRRTEQVLQKADSNNDLVVKDMDVLRKEVAGLNAVNAALEEQRDKLITELDNKTEQIFVLEKELGSIRVAKVDLEVTTDTLKKKISDSQSTEQQRTRSLRDLNSEAERCRQQIAQLQGTNKNLYADNRRLIDEHAELESRQALTKTQLKESQLEVEHLKQNLTQYVEKVQQIEHSLRHLEDEREEMLRTYESLSHGASALEDSKSAMELQAKEAKLQLCQAEEKITDLQEQLELQRQNCFSHENQVSAMSKQIDTLENEIEKLKDEKSLIKGDYAALKELVNKLDLQKEKLNAEVSEITNIQKTLERENGQLRSTLNSAKVGDKAAVDSLQELLTSTRKDLDEQRGAANKLSVEVKKLQVLLSESEAKCTAEHGISEKNKNLAKEYSIQIEELRHKLTDTRFAEVRNNETIGDDSLWNYEENNMSQRSYNDVVSKTISNGSTSSRTTVREYENTPLNSLSYQIWQNEIHNFSSDIIPIDSSYSSQDLTESFMNANEEVLNEWTNDSVSYKSVSNIKNTTKINDIRLFTHEQSKSSPLLENEKEDKHTDAVENVQNFSQANSIEDNLFVKNNISKPKEETKSAALLKEDKHREKRPNENISALLTGSSNNAQFVKKLNLNGNQIKSPNSSGAQYKKLSKETILPTLLGETKYKDNVQNGTSVTLNLNANDYNQFAKKLHKNSKNESSKSPTIQDETSAKEIILTTLRENSNYKKSKSKERSVSNNLETNGSEKRVQEPMSYTMNRKKWRNSSATQNTDLSNKIITNNQICEKNKINLDAKLGKMSKNERKLSKLPILLEEDKNNNNGSSATVNKETTDYKQFVKNLQTNDKTDQDVTSSKKTFLPSLPENINQKGEKSSEESSVTKHLNANGYNQFVKDSKSDKTNYNKTPRPSAKKDDNNLSKKLIAINQNLVGNLDAKLEGESCKEKRSNRSSLTGFSAPKNDAQFVKKLNLNGNEIESPHNSGAQYRKSSKETISPTLLEETRYKDNVTNRSRNTSISNTTDYNQFPKKLHENSKNESSKRPTIQDETSAKEIILPTLRENSNYKESKSKERSVSNNLERNGSKKNVKEPMSYTMNRKKWRNSSAAQNTDLSNKIITNNQIRESNKINSDAKLVKMSENERNGSKLPILLEEDKNKKKENGNLDTTDYKQFVKNLLKNDKTDQDVTSSKKSLLPSLPENINQKGEKSSEESSATKNLNANGYNQFVEMNDSNSDETNHDKPSNISTTQEENVSKHLVVENEINADEQLAPTLLEEDMYYEERSNGRNTSGLSAFRNDAQFIKKLSLYGNQIESGNSSGAQYKKLSKEIIAPTFSEEIRYKDNVTNESSDTLISDTIDYNQFARKLHKNSENESSKSPTIQDIRSSKEIMLPTLRENIKEGKSKGKIVSNNFDAITFNHFVKEPMIDTMNHNKSTHSSDAKQVKMFKQIRNNSTSYNDTSDEGDEFNQSIILDDHSFYETPRCRILPAHFENVYFGSVHDASHLGPPPPFPSNQIDFLNIQVTSCVGAITKVSVEQF